MAVMADALLNQIADPIASFTADGAYDQDHVTQAVVERHPDAAVIVPPRVGAVASASGYNLRAKVEASIGRYKRLIGDALRSRTDRTEATEVNLAAAALNQMLAVGRPKYVRIA